MAVDAGRLVWPTWRWVAAEFAAGWPRLLGSDAHLMCMNTAENTETATGRLWSIDDLSEYLGVSKSTVYDWRSRGDGPVAYRLGKHLKYARTDVDAWLATRRDNATVGVR